MTANEILANVVNTSVRNDPARKGQLASRKVLFGDYKRYALYAIHTRFDDIEWIVADAHVDDGGLPGIIRQAKSPEGALVGFRLTGRNHPVTDDEAQGDG